MRRFPTYTDEPRFIDQLAVDFVVGEHRYMKLTPSEKRHAAHRLTAQGVPLLRVSEILRVTPRTVSRMLEIDPPPIIDVDEHGNKVLLEDNAGQFCHNLGVA